MKCTDNIWDSLIMDLPSPPLPDPVEETPYKYEYDNRLVSKEFRNIILENDNNKINLFTPLYTHPAKLELPTEELNKVQDALCDISQLISGWKSTTPITEWSEFDENCINKLHISQTIVDNYLKQLK